MTETQSRALASAIEDTRNRAIFLLSQDGVEQAKIAALFDLSERGVRHVLARERAKTKRVSETGLVAAHTVATPQVNKPESHYPNRDRRIRELARDGVDVETIARRYWHNIRGGVLSFNELMEEEVERRNFSKWVETVKSIIKSADEDEEEGIAQ